MRLGEAQGRRERRAARRATPRCARGPWGPERTSRTWLPGAPVSMHPASLLPVLSPSPRRRTLEPCGPPPARRPLASASSPPASAPAPRSRSPCSPSSFSAVCPVKTLPGSRVPTTANPPLVTSSPAASALAPGCYGNAPRAQGRWLEGLGFGCRCPEAGRARGWRLRAARGAREARAARGAPVAVASRLNSEL